MIVIQQHPPSRDCGYLLNGMCYWCCETCNRDMHTCGGCGTPLNHQHTLEIATGQKHECG